MTIEIFIELIQSDIGSISLGLINYSRIPKNVHIFSIRQVACSMLIVIQNGRGGLYKALW